MVSPGTSLNLALRVLLSLRERIEVRVLRCIEQREDLIRDRRRVFQANFATGSWDQNARAVRAQNSFRKSLISVMVPTLERDVFTRFDCSIAIAGGIPRMSSTRVCHALEEWSHVRTEGFDVTALPFGVDWRRERAKIFRFHSGL